MAKEGVDQLRAVMRRYWGYDSFRPLQQAAMLSVLASHDSLVVLPTGGGKSLCFQVPALCREGLALVVSPLISLMKDQVDALLNNGIPAAFVNSTLSYEERRLVAQQIRSGQTRILYVAPERLASERTRKFLSELDLSLIAIDEAHCISAWGHDFRPEYRELSFLRERFPDVAVHAYTATATPRVQDDIAKQLALRFPNVLIGSFDRLNLQYKVQRRSNRLEQIREVIDRHPNESGVIYCISRKDVEQISQELVDLGYRALPYHAGMPDTKRRQHQEAFMEDRAQIIVATVAFGMGIDKPNVRYVVHAAMPKSLENFQQESGRAGRDGLEADCCLLFSGRDFHTWQRMIDDSEASARQGARDSLEAMWDFCNGVVCRHKGLVEHFGQQLDRDSCSSCDVCLGDLDQVEEPLQVAQKILSCVVRLDQQFGGDYTAKVLLGSNEVAIRNRRHDQLTTWGLLSQENRKTVRDWIEQLVSQRFLQKSGEYNVLQLTASGRRLLKGEVVPKLLRPAKPTRSKRTPASARETWEGVNRDLFEVLRQLRHEQAVERGVPPYMIFDDVALRDMARRQPTTPAAFHQVRGVGEKKLADFGQMFTECIQEWIESRE